MTKVDPRLGVNISYLCLLHNIISFQTPYFVLTLLVKEPLALSMLEAPEADGHWNWFSPYLVLLRCECNSWICLTPF